MSEYTLTAHDRCDQCGSRAYVRVTIDVSKSDIDFCNHHWNKHKSVLMQTALGWLDETEALNVKVDVSP